ncbi:MerR family transcriptional regulator [Nonomuraea rhizosphaerae]|uniref:MerR family transcriptional regulator n=1 Tax=Nonomuraea rhizosphaerae TaxID=2665663 RepID=UPI001C5EDBDB|nr:MerR family transcriptional regulator [Nonomuraea rhizosphaerae]
MNGDALYSIGDLARRTGLTVKTVRFYSDQGIVPPAERSPAGYRLYDLDAVVRLDLVRTLRDLGLDLPTIRRVLNRETSLAEVAKAHAEALAVQIRTLRLRRAVLTAVARRGSTPEELDLMHKLAKLSEHERRQLIGDFLGTVFGGLDPGAGFAGIARSLTPELPDNPGIEQVEAWVELAELSQDPSFRAVMRRMAEHHAAERAHTPGLRSDTAAIIRVIRARVGPALAAGLPPGSPEAGAIVTAITAERAPAAPSAGRLELADWLEAASDPRRERYLRLLAVINGWPEPESLAPAFAWCAEALRTRAA